MRWSIKPKPLLENIEHLQSALGVSADIAVLLAQREVANFEEARSFFRPTLEELHDPYLMKDMGKAVSRIEKAILTRERIMIYGDYDVDGTTSVALMSSYLKSIYPEVTTYIPVSYTHLTLPTKRIV